MLGPTVVAALLGLGGCPPRTGTGGNTGGEQTTLTDAQKTAVALVVKQLHAASAAFGTYSALADTKLDLDQLTALGSQHSAAQPATAASRRRT